MEVEGNVLRTLAVNATQQQDKRLRAMPTGNEKDKADCPSDLLISFGGMTTFSPGEIRMLEELSTMTPEAIGRMVKTKLGKRLARIREETPVCTLVHEEDQDVRIPA